MGIYNWLMGIEDDDSSDKSDSDQTNEDSDDEESDEDADEEDKPEMECSFQFSWDSDEEVWNCGLSDSVYCDKKICPYWNSHKTGK